MKYTIVFEHIDDDDVLIIKANNKNDLIDKLIDELFRVGFYQVGDWLK